MRFGIVEGGNLNARQLRLTCLYGVTTMGAAIIAMTQIAPDQYPPKIGYYYLALLVICLPTLMAVGMQRVKLTHTSDTKAAQARYESDKKLCNDETSSSARLQCRRDAKAEYDQAVAAAKNRAAATPAPAPATPDPSVVLRSHPEF